MSLGYGYDPKLPEMSAIFFAAGPHVCEHHLDEVRNIDVAPTILGLLGVRPADTVEGRASASAKTTTGTDATAARTTEAAKKSAPFRPLSHLLAEMPARTGRDSFVLCAAGMARSVGPTVTSCEAVKAKVTIQIRKMAAG